MFGGEKNYMGFQSLWVVAIATLSIASSLQSPTVWELHWLNVSAGFTSLSLSSLKQKDWLCTIWKAHIGCFGVLMAISKNKLGGRRFQSSSMLLPSMRVEVELDSMSAFLLRAVTAVNPLPAYSEVACLKTFRTFTIQSINVESMVRIEFKMNQLQHATYTIIDPYIWSESLYDKNSPAMSGSEENTWRPSASRIAPRKLWKPLSVEDMLGL